MFFLQTPGWKRVREWGSDANLKNMLSANYPGPAQAKTDPFISQPVKSQGMEKQFKMGVSNLP